MLFMSLPYCYYKMNIFSSVIVLVPFTIFQTYDITLCDCSHILLHCPRKRKIKSRKIDKKEKKNVSV